MTIYLELFFVLFAIVWVVNCVRFIKGLIVGRIFQFDRRTRPRTFALLMAAQPVGLLIFSLLVWYRVLLPNHLV